jgi:hypothetical protein
VRCTCPVCRQTADYPERYAGKWHRCAAGCAVVGTRMLLVRDGTGVLERALIGDRQHEVESEEVWRARARRVLLGSAGTLLVASPFLALLPRPISLALAGVGACLVLAACLPRGPGGS